MFEHSRNCIGRKLHLKRGVIKITMPEKADTLNVVLLGNILQFICAEGILHTEYFRVSEFGGGFLPQYYLFEMHFKSHAIWIVTSGYPLTNYHVIGLIQIRNEFDINKIPQTRICKNKRARIS